MGYGTVNKWVVISIHAPREGSDQIVQLFSQIRKISIHAPREGSDPSILYTITLPGISIHAPREGSDGKGL